MGLLYIYLAKTKEELTFYEMRELVSAVANGVKIGQNNPTIIHQ